MATFYLPSESGKQVGTYTKVRIKCVENSSNVTNNTTNITVSVEMWRKNTGYTTMGTGTLTLYIGSSDYTSSITTSQKITYNSYTTIGSAKTLNVTHNSDGTLSLYVGAKSSTSNDNITFSKFGGNIALTTIPRATTPTLSESSVNMGSSVTINLPRASSSFTHKISYTFGNLKNQTSGIGNSSSAGTSTTFTPPLSLANQVPNNTKGTATIKVQTYNGTSLVGEKSINLTVNVPTSVVPSISNVAISEAISGIAAKFGAFVQNNSKLSVAITAAGAYSSTISKYQTIIQGVTYSAASFTSNLLTTSGTLAVKTTITDSRGRTATVTNNITVLAYDLPKITNFTAFRCDANGNEDSDGTRIKVEINFSISPVNNLNDKYYEVVYRRKNTSDSWGAVASGNIYSRNDSFVSGSYFNTDYAYDVALQLYDYFTGTRATLDISTAFTLVDYHSSGKGIAFGKVAETQDLMDVDFPIFARKGISYSPIETGTDLNDITAPGFYGSESAGGNAFVNCPVSSGTFTLEVNAAGTDGQLYQKLVACSKDASITFERFYYGGAWGDWHKIKDFDGTLLWSGGWYMNENQTANFSENVSAQPNGIVLVFSPYLSGSSQNYNYQSFFIPKLAISTVGTGQWCFVLARSNFISIGTKYLYISDTGISGHVNNGATGTANGITYANNAFVLRYVIGV